MTNGESLKFVFLAKNSFKMQNYEVKMLITAFLFLGIELKSAVAKLG